MDNNIYRALVEYGFSPQKAAEIALDHERGDKYAAAFVDIALRKHYGVAGTERA